MDARELARMPDTEREEPSSPAAGKTVLLAMAAFVIAATVFLLRATPLSGDEPLYALRSRSFRWAQPPWFEWPSYRAPGLPLLAAPFVSLPEPVLRTIVVACAAASIWLVFVLARMIFGPRPGIWTAVVLTATPGLLASSVYFFPDLPGLFLALAAVVCMVRYLVGRGSHGWLVMMCGSLMVAGLVRFSVAIVVVGALVALLVAMPSLLEASRGRIVLTGALLLLLMAAGAFIPAPGAADGLSPWAANRELLSQNASSLSRRFTSLADTSSLAYGLPRGSAVGALAGAVFLLICGAGVVGGLRSAARQRDRLILFPITWFLMVLGFYSATLDHFEIRYLSALFVPVAMVSGIGLSHLSRQVAKPWATVLVLVTLGAGLFAGSYLVSDFLRADDAEDHAVREVGAFIAARDQECVLSFGSSGGKVWLLPWYSRCSATSVAGGASAYVAVWREAAEPASPPRPDARLALSQAFTQVKGGRTEHRVIDLYTVGE